MQGVLFTSANVLALIAAWSLSRTLMPGADRRLRLLTVAAGHPLIVLPSMTLLGMLGYLRLDYLLLLLLLLAVGLSLLALRRRREPLAGEQEARLGLEDSLLLGAVAGMGLLPTRRILQHHFVEPTRLVWDDFSYHATMPAHWMQMGKLAMAPYSYHAYYPANAELYCVWFMLPYRSDLLVPMAGFGWMLIGAIAVYVLCRELGVGAPLSAVSSLAMLSALPFDEQAGAFAATDLAAASLSCAGLAVWAGARRDGPYFLQRLFYAACFCGLAVGTKVTFAPLAAFTLLSFCHERYGWKWRQWWRPAAYFLACCLVCGGYWYLRNWSLTGNPIFPAKVFIFDGPLDEVTRQRTSLMYGWAQAEPALRDSIVDRLMNWPSRLLLVASLGYLATVLAALLPRSWKNPSIRRAFLPALAGLSLLLIIVYGPFSGTVNKPGAQVQIRLRFFLASALIGFALSAYWLARVRALGPFVVVAALALIGSTMEQSLGVLLSATLLGAALGPALTRVPPLRGRWASALGLVAILLLSSRADALLRAKRPESIRWMKQQTQIWNITKTLPPRSRITWYNTFQQHKYYRAFGLDQQFVPVGTNRDGSPFSFLHERWEQQTFKWWGKKPRATDLSKLVENLQDQSIEFVFMTKRHKGSWAPQFEVLSNDPRVQHLVERKSGALFRVHPPRR